MSNKKSLILSLVAILLAIGGYFFPQVPSIVSNTLGSTFGTRFPDGISIGKGAPLPTTQGALIIGKTGTQINNISAGTCYIKAWATTIAATSSAYVDCQATALVGANGFAALPGVLNGDAVQVTLATSTEPVSPYGGLFVASAAASTTNGYIQLEITNLTGGVFTWPSNGVASGTAYYTSMR